MKPQTFKTLAYKQPEDPEMPFAHVYFHEKYSYSGSVPQILQPQNTIQSMKNVFPNVDFSELKLITLTATYTP